VRRSAPLVIGHWWQALGDSLVFQLFSLVPGPLVGVLLLLTGGTAVELANAFSSFVFAITVPISVIGLTLVYRRYRDRAKLPSASEAGIVPESTTTMPAYGERNLATCVRQAPEMSRFEPSCQVGPGPAPALPACSIFPRRRLARTRPISGCPMHRSDARSGRLVRSDAYAGPAAHDAGTSLPPSSVIRSPNRARMGAGTIRPAISDSP
jgi:hypothetical protein